MPSTDRSHSNAESNPRYRYSPEILRLRSARLWMTRKKNAAGTMLKRHDVTDRAALFCHPEASAAPLKDLVAPPNEVAPLIRTVSDGADRSLALEC